MSASFGNRFEILLVDDELSVRRGIAAVLAEAGYAVRTAADGEEAMREIAERSPDLVLLDVMMPKMDGYAVCREVRKRDADLPIVFLTALNGELDEVRGLASGGDDFIRKDASENILLARIAAALRRSGEKSEDGEFSLGRARVDSFAMQVTCEGRARQLSVREIEMLRHFSAHPGEVFSKDWLLTRFWGADFAGGDSALAMQVSRLREKIAGSGGSFDSVHGVGYSLRLSNPQ